MHTLKKTVYIWTVNNEIDMLRFILYGVDGIVSNYPQILKKANKAIGKILKDAHLYK
jgi:glycerophosphoryl diester phosphodiesterase